MAGNLEEAEEVAKEYIGDSSQLKRLGWGVSGFVFSRAVAGVPTAIKVHKNIEGYEREVRNYEFLRRRGIQRVAGFEIPQIRKVRDRSLLLEMDFMFPPYMLDFAGAHLSKPDYEEHVWEFWRQGVHRMFGANEFLAMRAHEEMRKIGIWYMDIRPSNINITGHPLAEPESTAEPGDPSPY